MFVSVVLFIFGMVYAVNAGIQDERGDHVRAPIFLGVSIISFIAMFLSL